MEENEEIVLTGEQKKEIEEKVAKLKKEKKLKKIKVIVIVGDDRDEEKLFIGYFKEPSLKDFSKFSKISKEDEVRATKQLAIDCYLDGPKDIYEDDSLFLFGLMPQLVNIMNLRNSKISNL